jgi:protein-L-isoaspartate O-methyltransferase
MLNRQAQFEQCREEEDMISNLKKALENAKREIAVEPGLRNPATEKTPQEIPASVLRDEAEVERVLRA